MDVKLYGHDVSKQIKTMYVNPATDTVPRNIKTKNKERPFLKVAVIMMTTQEWFK